TRRSPRRFRQPPGPAPRPGPPPPAGAAQALGAFFPPPKVPPPARAVLAWSCRRPAARPAPPHVPRAAQRSIPAALDRWEAARRRRASRHSACALRRREAAPKSRAQRRRSGGETVLQLLSPNQPKPSRSKRSQRRVRRPGAEAGRSRLPGRRFILHLPRLPRTAAAQPQVRRAAGQRRARLLQHVVEADARHEA